MEIEEIDINNFNLREFHVMRKRRKHIKLNTSVADSNS